MPNKQLLIEAVLAPMAFAAADIDGYGVRLPAASMQITARSLPLLRGAVGSITLCGSGGVIIRLTLMSAGVTSRRRSYGHVIMMQEPYSPLSRRGACSQGLSHMYLGMGRCPLYPSSKILINSLRIYYASIFSL